MARTDNPSAPLRRRRSVTVATLACAGALLVGCGDPGQVPQSDTVGADAQVGEVLLRNVHVEPLAPNGYPGGSDAMVRLTLINKADRADTLTAVTSDVATQVRILGDARCAGGQGTVAGLDLPADSSPDGSEPAGSDHAVRLADLRIGIVQGGTVPVTFHFAHAGTITLPTPVDAGPRPSVACTGR